MISLRIAQPVLIPSMISVKFIRFTSFQSSLVTKDRTSPPFSSFKLYKISCFMSSKMRRYFVSLIIFHNIYINALFLIIFYHHIGDAGTESHSVFLSVLSTPSRGILTALQSVCQHKKSIEHMVFCT